MLLEDELKLLIFLRLLAGHLQLNFYDYLTRKRVFIKVKALFGADDFFKSFESSVNTYQGTVQLSGLVNSQKAVDKASESVRSVKGVKSIKMSMIVK